MKKIMMLGITSLILFAASAGGSWLMFHQSSAAAEDKATATPVVQQPANITPVTNDGDLKVAFTPEDISVETLMRIVSSIKSREIALDSKQTLINNREQRVGMVLSDLEREQKEIRELNSTVEAKMKRVQELVQQIERKPPSAAPGTSGDAKDNLSATGGYGIEEIKRLAKWLEAMDESDAASTVKEFVNDGKIDLVAMVMVRISDRAAPKILAALNDQTLIADIATAMLKIKSTK